ncbi:MAG TPA: hypothetical protein VFT43_04510, partial [Candidatus Polarisedimenticolia bacterium]|nr:hypothetical protein [Candidatus Polarisedimenticolia bacterium]
MFGKSNGGSRLSILILFLSLILIAFLPSLVVGRVGSASGLASRETASSIAPSGLPSTFEDTTAADFGAGTLDAGGYIAETANGEVILAPAFGAEFSGSALPTGMSIVPWAPGGTATLAGGVLTLDGARVGTDAVFGPGRAVEFSATYSGASESIGFGQTLQTPPWAIFRTNIFAINILASTNNGTERNSTMAGRLLGSAHRFRIDWTLPGVIYSVDGTPVVTHTNSPAVDMRPILSDMFVGGKVLTVDWIRMTPYAESTIFLSRIFDAGSPARWVDLSPTAGVPEGTGLSIETRSGNTNPPDETWSDWAGLGTDNAISSPNAQFLQYRAALTTTNPGLTPSLEAVLIHYLAPCGDEICNGIDDDCDGQIDEGGDALCSDHDACNGQETCQEGACKPGSVVNCDDGNPCTDDTCDAQTGACSNVVKEHGTACDDGNACTKDDACSANGQCVGVEVVCNDQNACTKDACENGACVFTP